MWWSTPATQHWEEWGPGTVAVVMHTCSCSSLRNKNLKGSYTADFLSIVVVTFWLCNPGWPGNSCLSFPGTSVTGVLSTLAVFSSVLRENSGVLCVQAAFHYHWFSVMWWYTVVRLAFCLPCPPSLWLTLIFVETEQSLTVLASHLWPCCQPLECWDCKPSPYFRKADWEKSTLWTGEGLLPSDISAAGFV